MKKYSDKKLFIATVGTGASGADIAHAIFFSIEQQNPNDAVFIVSKDTREKTIPFIEEKLKSEKPHVLYTIELVEEVNEFEILHRSYLDIIKKYIKKGYKPRNIVVDYTSGTKAMSAALVSSAIAAEVNSISYIYGQRGNGGRVISGSEKVTSLSPNLFTTEKRIQQAVVLFNKYLFDAASELLTSFENLPHPVYDVKIRFITKLADALSAWDKFNFNTAFKILQDINNDGELIDEARRMSIGINKLTQAANQLKENKLDEIKILELIENAKRRGDEHKYDDAVARIYRAIEMAGQIEFEREFGCSTSDVLLNKLPHKQAEEIEKKYRDQNDGKIKLPLFAVFELLSDQGNNVGKIFSENKDDFQKVLHRRNYSILAHGSIPISESDFKKSLNLIEIFTESIKPGVPLPKFPIIR